MSTHNIGIYEDLTKIIFELSSNTHLISSAVGLTALTERNSWVKESKVQTISPCLHSSTIISYQKFSFATVFQLLKA